MYESELPQGLEELIAGYVLGNLSPEEAEEFQQLLKVHPELNKEVNHLQEVLGMMPYSLPDIAPPPRLRDAILQATDTQATDTNGEIQIATKNTSISWLPITDNFVNWYCGCWRKIAAGAVAFLLVGLVIDNYLLRQKLYAQTSQQKDVITILKNPSTRLVSLKGMDQANTASGSIAIAPGQQEAVLVVQNLPLLPEGQIYQLWAIVNGQRISWGQFHANSKGTMLVKLSIPPVDRVSGLVVTVEVSPAPWQPDGAMVMTSNL